MQFTLEVNGRSHTVDVDADTPLLWVLRDAIELKGTKFGCGAGCAVHARSIWTAHRCALAVCRSPASARRQ